MLTADILKTIECAIPHECSKLIDESYKCCYCEVGYAFIVHDPVVLQCGHHICQECVVETQKGCLNCKICSQEMKCTNTKGTAAEMLVKLFLNDYSKELKEKFLKSVDLYQGKFREQCYLLRS